MPWSTTCSEPQRVVDRLQTLHHHMTPKWPGPLPATSAIRAIFASMSEKRLLIVDDSVVIISRLKDLLEGLRGIHAIDVAHSYADALSLLTTAPPDITLLDINLPDRNGIEVLRYVRQYHPAIVVIMISNQGGVFYRDLCLRLGAARYIDKSTEFELIPTLLSSLLTPEH
jgi:CheY-like chemotaxis protein